MIKNNSCEDSDYANKLCIIAIDYFYKINFVSPEDNQEYLNHTLSVWDKIFCSLNFNQSEERPRYFADISELESFECNIQSIISSDCKTKSAIVVIGDNDFTEYVYAILTYYVFVFGWSALDKFFSERSEDKAGQDLAMACDILARHIPRLYDLQSPFDCKNYEIANPRKEMDGYSVYLDITVEQMYSMRYGHSEDWISYLNRELIEIDFKNKIIKQR